MQLPTPQPVSTSHYCVIGDVSIHPHAKIAPGVVLQAAPQSNIEVAAGVCIGMGVVIQACQGSVVLNVNVTLGAGVLVIGTVDIGANACIGDSTTIINTNVATLQVVPEGSLLGDGSRPPSGPSDYLSTLPSPSVENRFSQGGEAQNHNSFDISAANANRQQSSVIGRAYVNQMLHIMFARNSL